MWTRMWILRQSLRTLWNLAGNFLIICALCLYQEFSFPELLNCDNCFVIFLRDLCKVALIIRLIDIRKGITSLFVVLFVR